MKVDMNSYGSIGDLVDAKLVRYKGSEWNKDIGIRAIGQSKYHIDESIKSLTIRLMNGTELVVTRDELNIKNYDGSHIDFVCDYEDIVTSQVNKFSLFKYLGSDYDVAGLEDDYTSRHVLVLEVNPNDNTDEESLISTSELEVGKKYMLAKVLGSREYLNIEEGEVIKIHVKEGDFFIVSDSDNNLYWLSVHNKSLFKEVK